MKVTTVSASVRFSKSMENGHKTIELSAEAALEPKDNWKDAQSQLYSELGEQLKTLWITKTSGQPTNGTAKTKDSTNEHYCVEHGVEFKRYEKEGRGWYAHKAENKWCREK